MQSLLVKARELSKFGAAFSSPFCSYMFQLSSHLTELITLTAEPSLVIDTSTTHRVSGRKMWLLGIEQLVFESYYTCI